MRVLAAILVALGVLAVSTYPAQAGGDGTIRAGSYEVNVGEQVTVVLEAVDILPPGLGAWTIDLSYDNSTFDAIGCDAEPNGVCSEAFSDDTVRATGASQIGLTGTFTLATFEFRCDAAGTTELIIHGGVLATPDPVIDIDMPLEDGSITCTKPSDLITISSLDLEVGDEGKVRVEVERVVQPGVGAWMLDISYDSSLVSLVVCDVLDELSECSEESAGILRVRGVSADGLQSGTVLAELEFRCDQHGETSLTGDVEIWSIAAVAVPGDERALEIQDGSVACGLEIIEPPLATPTALPLLPNTGGAEPQSPAAPVAVPLALGVVLLAAAFAFRRYALR